MGHKDPNTSEMIQVQGKGIREGRRFVQLEIDL
jgi:hypothetical protein